MISNDTITQLTDQLVDELVGLRRQIHANPEIGFEEYETAALVSKRLEKDGIEHKTGVAKTGIVSLIQGKGKGRVVGIRADLDCLPMDEKSTVAFTSKVPGRAHTCGHDVHTTIALGAALVLNKLSDQFEGTVKVVFQPAEEGLDGANLMIEEGVLENPSFDTILGFHNWPLLEAGTVGYHPDVVMSSADVFDVTLTGVSGHGAHPHLAVDVISAAAYFITQLQTIVSREIAPVTPAVVTIGKIIGGTAHNQLPDVVTMHGSVRTQTEDARGQIKDAMSRLLEGLKIGMRVEYDLVFTRGSPVLRNNPAILPTYVSAARNILGSDKVVQMPSPSMGSEDFAEFAIRVPAAHLRIGSKVEGLDTMIHKSNYECNELAIPVGINVVCRAVLDLLAADSIN
ncbi:MAG: M20 metallopeptidase family protein [Alphaproteobacteria bacterium]